MSRRTKDQWCADNGIDPRLYSAWIEMRQRCYNSNAKQFKNYGGRGITVCARWHVFSNFEKDMGPHPGRPLPLDRKRVNGNYRRGNCQWAGTKVQARNQRRTKLNEIKADEIRAALASGARGCDLAEQYGVSRAMITRIKTGLAWC